MNLFADTEEVTGLHARGLGVPRAVIVTGGAVPESPSGAPVPGRMEQDRGIAIGEAPRGPVSTAAPMLTKAESAAQT